MNYPIFTMKHGLKEISGELERARFLLCRVEILGNTIKIFPQRKELGFYLAHKTQSALHPLRRYLNRVEKDS